MLPRSTSSTEPNKRTGSVPLVRGTIISLTLVLATVGLMLFWSERPASIASSAKTPAPQSTGGLSEAGCTEAVRTHPGLLAQKRSVVCGRLTVPETEKSLFPVKLSVVQIGCSGSRRAAANRCQAVPLLVLPGGPGDSMIGDLASRLDRWLPRVGERGLVFVDLRGTGTSEPALICRDAIKRTRDLERCHEKWSAEIDLDSFRTQMIVSDLRYVLTELSLEKVSVYGVSYGTHVATEFTRSFPHMVEGLVLDSPLPRGVDVLSPLAKNAQWALNEVLLSCQKEGTCGPDLSLNRLAALVARLDQESQGAQYSGLQFLSQLSSRLYSPEVLRHLPYFILSAEKGDFRILKGLSDQLAGGRFAWGMHLSVQCAERFALTDAEKIERADSVVLPAFQPALSARDYASYCEIWKVRPEMALGPAAPIDVPTLVLSGRWDGVTPPEYARLAVRDLSHVRVVELPNLGHGAGMASCGSLWIRAFLDAPEKSLAELEVHCKRPESPYFLTTMPSEDSVQIMVAELLHTL